MGCDTSKETEKQFNDTIFTLNKKLVTLHQQIRDLNREIDKLKENTVSPVHYDNIKKEITSQVKDLEDLWEKIHQPPDAKLHSSLSRADEDFDFTPEPDILMSEFSTPSKSEVVYYSSFEDPTTVSGKHITDDPFIKAIVESKKKALERKKL